MTPIKHNIEIGQKFSRLEVIEIVKINNIRKIKCKCICGKIKIIKTNDLVRGVIKSCGCYQKDFMSSKKGRKNPTFKHGMKHSKIYRTWCHIKERCYNSNCKEYKYYGEKGVKLFEIWKDFNEFYKWAMENGYKDTLTIERKDNSKDYCPENCCWIPKQEQGKNKTNNHKITAWGETKNLVDWTRDSRCQIESTSINNRLKKGMSPELAISLPSQPGRKFNDYY